MNHKFSPDEDVDTGGLPENSNNRAGLLPLAMYGSFYFVGKYISGVNPTDNFKRKSNLCKDSEEYQEMSELFR
jgi:hypothetical protein